MQMRLDSQSEIFFHFHSIITIDSIVIITFTIELKAKIQKLVVIEFNPLLHLYDLLTNIR